MKQKNYIFYLCIIIFILIMGILITSYIINKNTTGELKKITYKELVKKEENEEDLVLIISRTNCSHCIEYKPKVETIAKKYNIIIYYLDFDEETESDTKELLNNFNLDGSTPITLFIKDGKETSVLKRLEGDVEKENVIERLKEMEFIK